MGKLDIQEKNKPKRNAKGQLEKGYSGNPKGRPPKEKSFSDTARRLLNATELDIDLITEKDGEKKVEKVKFTANQGLYHALVCALLKEGMRGNVQAIRELIDRADGKVREKVDLIEEQVIRIVDAKDELLPDNTKS